MHGFLYSNGHYTTLNDPFGKSWSGTTTAATGINDKGQIVGNYTNSKGIEHSFLYSNGTYTTLNHPLGTHGTTVEGINDHAQIVGIYLGDSGGHAFHT
jgi:probable HAF family extracellular repeat protein